MSVFIWPRKVLTASVQCFTSSLMCEEPYADECKELDENLDAIKVGGLLYIRMLVTQKRYALSSKAYRLHADGYYELEDLENSICCGSVQKTQKDE